MANILVQSMKRLYENGLRGKTPSVTKEQAAERVKTGKITEADYEYITGEAYA